MALISKNKILNADVIFAFFIGSILFVLLFPLPPVVLSILLVISMAVSLVLLMMIF